MLVESRQVINLRTILVTFHCDPSEVPRPAPARLQPGDSSGRRRRVISFVSTLGLAALLPWLGGCKLFDVGLSSGEPLSKADQALRHQTREFVGEFAAAIQHATEEVSHAADDRRIKEDAVRWRIGAIRSIRQATLRPSPTLAIVDSWALCRQMSAYLASDAGRELFGSGQGTALTNAQAMEARVAAMARRGLSRSELKEVDDFLAGYVKEFPLRNLDFEREPVAARWEAVGGPRQTPSGTTAEALADLSDRFQIFTEQVPAELRWRLSLELGQWQEMLGETRDTMRDIDVAMKSIAATAGAAPVALSNAVHELRGLAPALTGLEKQWSLTLGAVDGQRAALAKDIAGERAAILQAVDQQRIAILQSVDQQRIALVKTVDEQRAAMMKEVQQVAGEVTERSMKQARGLVRDVLFYAVLFLIVLLGLPFYFGFLVGRVASRNRKSAGVEPAGD